MTIISKSSDVDPIKKIKFLSHFLKSERFDLEQRLLTSLETICSTLATTCFVKNLFFVTALAKVSAEPNVRAFPMAS